MSLESLLNERDALRKEIEQIRKQNEKTLLYIKGFYAKIIEYVNFCEANDINICAWHEFDDSKYLITCNKNTFSINGYEPRCCESKGPLYVSYEDGTLYSSIGSETTLETITEKDGSLKEKAKWFDRNIETIANLVEEDFEKCVRRQIEEAKKMLGKD